MAARVVLLVVLVALAGCSSFTGPGTETSTVTPAPVPDHETTATESEPLPPGVTATGVEDVDALARAHITAVRNASYTWNDSKTENITGNDESIVDGINHVARVQDETTFTYWTDRRLVWQDGRARRLGNYTEFSDQTGRYVRYETGESGTVFREMERTEAHSRIGRLAASSIQQYLDVQNATVSAARIDGERYYEVVGDRTPFVAAQPVENYTVRAMIRHDGFVRSLEVSYVEGMGSQQKHVRYTFLYSELGETTVERPDWFGENPETETVSTTENGE